jgi:tRNA pseudouridine38-40 synthase
MIKIRVTGSGFLYNMVRIIAGTLLDIGSGLMEVSDIDKCLESCDRADAGNTAPACGLTMIEIEFK